MSITGFGAIRLRAPAPYRAVASVPGLSSLLGWALVARLHLSATLVAIVLVAADRTGSYARAGMISAALVLGQGIAGPLRGRAVDRRPAARGLIATSLVYGCGLLTLAAWPVGSPWPLFALAAFAVGTVLPPTTQVGRAKVAQCAGPAARPAAYSIQATGNELALVLGPALASTALAFVGATGALVGAAAAAVVGSAGLARAVRRAGVDQPAALAGRAASGPRLVAVPGVVALTAVMAVLVASFAVVDLALVSWGSKRGTPALGGLLTAVWAAGSVAGGLVHAARATGAPVQLPRRLVVIAIGLVPVVLVLPPLGPGTPWAVTGLLLASGSVIPGAVAAVYDRLADLAGDDRRAEAFGWLAVATTTGTAIAGAAAGVVFEHMGPAWAASLAVVGAAAAAFASLGVPDASVLDADGPVLGPDA